LSDLHSKYWQTLREGKVSELVLAGTASLLIQMEWVLMVGMNAWKQIFYRVFLKEAILFQCDFKHS
jgi:hypothetical protein